MRVKTGSNQFLPVPTDFNCSGRAQNTTLLEWKVLFWCNLFVSCVPKLNWKMAEYMTVDVSTVTLIALHSLGTQFYKHVFSYNILNFLLIFVGLQEPFRYCEMLSLIATGPALHVFITYGTTSLLQQCAIHIEVIMNLRRLSIHVIRSNHYS